MNYLYGRNLSQYPQPQYPQQQYNAYATKTTFDFQNPSTTNVQNVLKDHWTSFAIMGVAGIFLGVTKLIPWGSPTLHYITGAVGLLGAGYGYMLSKNP